jgi:hypothetical protein
MVNHGPSQGCITCKQRRVKCDEAKPECRQCQRLSLCCGGYKTRPANLKFRDQTHKFGNIKVRKNEAILGCRQLKDPDTAVPFYLGHYVNIGRRTESARGFFEVLTPVYSAQRQDSALSLAVSAVASEVLNLWCYGPASLSWSRESYSQAVVGLRRAIQDPVEQNKPATTMAILTLQWYENIAAIYGHRSATPTHHSGALSLLPFMSSDDTSKDQPTIASIRSFITHAEISSAIRQKRPVHGAISSWIRRGGLLTTPGNPSSVLDAIGATVADLQARYAHHVSVSLGTFGGFAAEAKVIDQQLLTWSWSVPEHWQPVRLSCGQDFDTSIPAYRSSCEIYPSSQIGNIWNLWRVYRLSLVRIIFESSHPESQESTAVDQDVFRYEQVFRELVDAVCYSVPFYLGNRIRLMNVTDFHDFSISLCRHSLSSQDSPGQFPQLLTSASTSEDEHRRHIIAQGPWHIMSPLSRLLTLFAEDDKEQLTRLLGSGQHEWMREQFLRVTTLLHLSPPNQDSAVENWGQGSLGPVAVDTRADYLANILRRGAMFMSGP